MTLIVLDAVGEEDHHLDSHSSRDPEPLALSRG